MTSGVRFGCQFADQGDLGPVEVAQRAEAVGFDVFTMSDHVGLGLAPMPTLAAVAAATSRIRLGTLVLNATMRNPVQLAWEASTLDQLSGGRFELGLGAGHTPHEYAQTGVERSSPAVRKAQLAEQVEIMRALLDGETVDHDGAHHRVQGAAIGSAGRGCLPILVGGNGAALLGHAGAHADIIGLQGLGRTLDDGHRHSVKWSSEHLDRQLEQVRIGAGARFDQLEFNALVQVVEITDDAEASIADLAERVDGLTIEDVATTPYALIGTVEQIAEKIRDCGERWGIRYFSVRSLEAFAPVIDTIRSEPE
jgi:probable F420-dependent oxidoreductase